ncbi:MAG: hypothetical protein NDJ65_01405 [Paludibacteraceae bacterium]|nr:hypothetical protein [Paludibacteraceae bacterium]
MKKLLITMIAIATAVGAMAQDKRAEFNKKLIAAQTDEMAYRLKMNDAQKKEFSGIYEQYCHEVLNAKKTMDTKRKEITDSIELEKNRLEKQRKVLDIRITYADRFGKVLSGDQLRRLYKEENEIQRRLKREIKQAQREQRAAQKSKK